MRTRDHFSAYSHLLGALCSMAGLVMLVVLAARERDPWLVISFSIFGASLLLLYTASGTYHLMHTASPMRRALKKLDRSSIYLLIAGTFTPICLTVLRGPLGWTLFGLIWACAITGIMLELFAPIPGWASTMFYIAMGWLAVIAVVPLYRALPPIAITWLFLGGILYTIGAGFFGLDTRYPSQGWFNFHDLFHIFVIGGSVSHFLFMLHLV